MAFATTSPSSSRWASCRADEGTKRSLNSQGFISDLRPPRFASEIHELGGVGTVLLATNVQPVLDIINNWIFVARALVGSIGALAFVLAFLWKMTAVEPNTVLPGQ